MGSKGNKRHVKRFNTPKLTNISKKQYKFFYNTRPGPHSKGFSLPIAHILRDILKIVPIDREAKKLIGEGNISVDGIVRRDKRFPVGLMDVFEIPSINKKYRIIATEKGLVPIEISDKEKNFKLCRIENKTTLSGGNIQLNLHDGRNIIIPIKDPKNPKEDTYKTMGVLKIEVPSQKILDYYPLKEGSPVLVIKGKNLGLSGSVKAIVKRFGPNASVVKVNSFDNDDEIKETAYAYTFVLGKSKPEIKLMEEE